MPVRFAFLTDTHHYPDAPVASKLMARAVVLGVCGDDAGQAASTGLSAAAGRACGGICGFAGISGGWRSVRLRQSRLTFRNLLFAVFVEGIHDIVQALIYDLAVAPHHRHRFPPAQIHQIHISSAL